MGDQRTSVGLDVHARSVSAAAIDESTGEVVRAKFGGGVEELLPWIVALPGPASVAYEAGPTGFGLARALTAAGIDCTVAAPSKIARPAGDHVKTDGRDALLLARLLRLDELTPVRVPSPAQEAARDLVRARDAVRGDLMRARHRVSKLLLRHGYVFDGRTAWGRAHERWMRSLPLSGATAIAFEAGYDTMRMTLARRDRLDAEIAKLAEDSEFAPTVRRLACLRGISTLTAFGLAVEIGDWHRFTGSSIGSYLGLVPSEHSSGRSRKQGPITKAGNTHARRLMVEAAWQHRSRYRVGKVMLDRWAQVPDPVRARGHEGNIRLNQRWQSHLQRQKKPVIANVAVAREMAGWCWSLATMPD